MTPPPVHLFDSIASTNDEAMRLLREGTPDGTMVSAKRQNGGRGRMGRAWESSPGNVYVSVVARVELPARLAGRLAVTCGRVVADLLRDITELPVRTKWPNDLYLEGRKLGGILVETRLGPGGVIDGVVAGLGLNVASHPNVPPPGQPATSLSAHGFRQEAGVLWPALASMLWLACTLSDTANWLEMMSHTEALELAIGPLTVSEGGEEYEAVGERIAEDGALIVRREGKPSRVTAGEVSVRPVMPG